MDDRVESPRIVLPTLSTDRLELRPVNETDLPLMQQLNADPDVMTYIRGRAATPDETASEWLQRLTHQTDAARGLGYWVGFEGGVFAGWWSASSFETRSDVSGIGYRLRRTSWGRGLATEGACAMIGQAFSVQGIERVFASTMAVNTGSRRVLTKLGLAHTSTWVRGCEDPVPGWEMGEVGYELTRAEWQS